LSGRLRAAGTMVVVGCVGIAHVSSCSRMPVVSHGMASMGKGACSPPGFTAVNPPRPVIRRGLRL
jgi:hypothetical protein